MSFTKVRLREAWNWGGLTLKELGKRTLGQMTKHNTVDQAAVVAFYAISSLLPFLAIVLAAALGMAGQVADAIRSTSEQLKLPPEATKLIQSQVDQIRSSPPTGILSFGFVVLLWSASSLFATIMYYTNVAYGLEDRRPWWKRRLMAILLTVFESVLFLGAALSIIVWPKAMGWLGLSAAASVLAAAVHWLVVLVALLASFAIAYYFTPDAKMEWEWITPGSAFGVLLLILMSLGLRLYVQYGSSYSATYGTLAGVVITLLWLYLAGLALLIGAEINAVIEHAAPKGKAPGQRHEQPTRAAG